MRVGGVVGLDLLFVAVGTVLLFAAGLVRSRWDALRLLGVSLLCGWALLGLAASFLLMAGADASVYELLAVAGIVVGAALNLGRRVPQFAPKRMWRLSGAGLVAGAAGALLLVLYLGELLRRVRLAQPSTWDSWAFWVPKAMTIVFAGGLGMGPGSVESFANPDYPPFVPAADATVFRFADTVDPGLLPVQHWILAVALFAALVGLLWHRVSPGLLMPPLAALALLPVYGRDVGSLLGDEALLTAFALAGVAGALWLLEREPRYLVLYALFGSVMALAKNEGFTYVILMGVLLVLGSLPAGFPHRWLPIVAIPALAMVPWKIWLHANNVPPQDYYHFGDLFKPSYLGDRFDRLGTTFRELPQHYLSFDRWLLTLPIAAALVLMLLRRSPRLALFATGTVVIGFLGNVAVYWISPSPVHWYIDTSGDRTATGPLVFAATLLPVLAAEAFGRTETAPLDLWTQVAAMWRRVRTRPRPRLAAMWRSARASK